MMIVKCVLPSGRKVSIGQEVLISDKESSFVKKMVMDDKFFDAYVQAILDQPKGLGERVFFLTKLGSSGELEFHGPAPWQDW
jgi:hypothetical protein